MRVGINLQFVQTQKNDKKDVHVGPPFGNVKLWAREKWLCSVHYNNNVIIIGLVGKGYAGNR